MKKTVSLLLSLIMIISALLIPSVSSYAANAIKVDAEFNRLDGLISLEMVIFGENMKGLDVLKLSVSYDTELVYSVFNEEIVGTSNITGLQEDDDGKRLIITFNFMNEIDSDEKTELCRLKFYPQAGGIAEFEIAAENDVVIDGKTSFEYEITWLPYADFEKGVRYTIENNEIKIFDFIGYPEGDVVIPAEMNGMPVVAIGEYAIRYKDFVKINNVFIPSSVTKIDDTSIGWINATLYDNGITIHGTKGSAAEKYAIEKGMFFHECSEYHVTEKYSIGDVNNDSNITAADARLALRAAAKLENLTVSQFAAADIIRNSTVNAADARIILRIAAKLEAIENYK